MFKNNAFTLIELLIVISVIAILASVTLVILNPAVLRNRAQDSTRREDLSVIQGALERWYSDNNQYPNALPGAGAAFIDDQGDANPANDVNYLRAVPGDPDGTVAVPINYAYTQSSPQDYRICATLEQPGPNENDDDGATPLHQYCVINPF